MKIIVCSIIAVLILQARSCSGPEVSEPKPDASDETSPDADQQEEVASEDSVNELELFSCDEIPLHINSTSCGKTYESVFPRAEAGDYLCVGKENCYETLGSPEHGGCPNTCSCMCLCGVCYRKGCTLVDECTEPPVYR
jgi:hypothetical protein